MPRASSKYAWAHNVYSEDNEWLCETLIPLLYEMTAEGPATEDQARRVGEALRAYGESVTPKSLPKAQRARQAAGKAQDMFMYIDEKPGSHQFVSKARQIEGPDAHLNWGYGSWHARLRTFRNDSRAMFDAIGPRY